ncbi:MAG: bifunctional glutamate N-acetyltransferase/amino-acid acetyltransferase ArgJ [Planctomycetales bacterium]|nr:bifunctional glutamate N-acetyltransferase/amino-acid acetyltransferase ArgJ [Planctomycetales bacterium]
MSDQIPLGFQFAGVYCGIKRDTSRLDLSLIVADRPCVAAGVYTQNQVVAAPVLLDRERTPSDSIRAIVTNSGNANACTGELGLQNAREMARLTADAIGSQPEEVLVLSTGIIGEQLPIDKVAAGIQMATPLLAADDPAVTAAARGMMTTDTRHKVAVRDVTLSGTTYRILGLAKGAAMIGPNMATMLGIILTDAPLTKDAAQAALRDAVVDSFNCISVEGHMSTNDTVLMLSSGAAGDQPLSGADLGAFNQAIKELAVQLAREIPDDGEGATHLIEIHVTDCDTRANAEAIAKAIANSALVKTAVHGADPNWGRIVSAAGYSGVTFDPRTVELTVNGFKLFEHGRPLSFDAETVSASIRDNRLTDIRLKMGQGTESVRFWTCDLSAEYIHLNADYHT